MKLTLSRLVAFLLLTGVSFAAKSSTQEILDKPVTLHVKNQSLKEILRRIETIVQVKFAYTRGAIISVNRISISADEERLSEGLDKLSKPDNLNYQVVGRQIIVCQNISLNKTDALQSAEPIGEMILGKLTPCEIAFNASRSGKRQRCLF
jgi:hypothetical protein